MFLKDIAYAYNIELYRTAAMDSSFFDIDINKPIMIIENKSLCSTIILYYYVQKIIVGRDGVK